MLKTFFKILNTIILISLIQGSLCVANTSFQIIIGAASERAQEGSGYSDHRLVTCLHSGRDHQLSPCY